MRTIEFETTTKKQELRLVRIFGRAIITLVFVWMISAMAVPVMAGSFRKFHLYHDLPISYNGAVFCVTGTPGKKGSLTVEKDGVKTTLLKWDYSNNANVNGVNCGDIYTNGNIVYYEFSKQVNKMEKGSFTYGIRKYNLKTGKKVKVLDSNRAIGGLFENVVGKNAYYSFYASSIMPNSANTLALRCINIDTGKVTKIKNLKLAAGFSARALNVYNNKWYYVKQKWTQINEGSTDLWLPYSGELMRLDLKKHTSEKINTAGEKISFMDDIGDGYFLLRTGTDDLTRNVGVLNTASKTFVKGEPVASYVKEVKLNSYTYHIFYYVTKIDSHHVSIHKYDTRTHKGKRLVKSLEVYEAKASNFRDFKANSLCYYDKNHKYVKITW